MPHKPPTTSRLEAFSDGVIAVIITIMVLELKVPHQVGVAGLYAVLPTLSIYLLSFAFIAIYWMNHQHLVRRIELADRVVQYANLAFLFWLSLLPFATSYVLEKNMDSFAVSFYSIMMLVIGLSYLGLRLAVHRNLRRQGQLEGEDLSARNKHLLSLLSYVAATALSYIHPQLALGLIALVTVVWIIPDLRLESDRH